MLLLCLVVCVPSKLGRLHTLIVLLLYKPVKYEPSLVPRPLPPLGPWDKASMNLPGIIVKSSMSGQIVIIIVLCIKQYELVYRLGEVLLANNCKQCTNQTIITTS